MTDLRVLGFAGTITPDGTLPSMRVLGFVGTIRGTGSMRVLGFTGTIGTGSAAAPQVVIRRDDGTVSRYDAFITRGGIRQRARFVRRIGTPGPPPPPSGTEKPWTGPLDATRLDMVGIAGATLELADLTTITVDQLVTMQTAAAISGKPIRLVNVVGTIAKPVTDPGGLVYEYCRFVGMIPSVARGPINSSYDTYNRPTGTNGKTLILPNYGVPRSTFRFCDIGQTGINGEKVYPWVASGNHDLGAPLAYGGHVWRVLVANSNATPPSGSNTQYMDLGVNPSRSVAFSNFISSQINTGINTTDALHAGYVSLGPYLTSGGASSWTIAGDPLMYAGGVWDALPGSFFNVAITEGPKLFYRCKIIGGGDVTRVNAQVEWQRCYVAGVNKGFAGGYLRIAGMYPNQPELFFWHADMMQSVGIPNSSITIQNVLINECYLRGMTDDGTQLANSALIAKGDSGAFNVFHFTNNIVDGGNYTIYPCVTGTAKKGATDCLFSGNMFGTPGQGYQSRYGPAGWGNTLASVIAGNPVAQVGPRTGVTWDNTNVWLENGSGVVNGATRHWIGGQPVVNPTTWAPNWT